MAFRILSSNISPGERMSTSSKIFSEPNFEAKFLVNPMGYCIGLGSAVGNKDFCHRYESSQGLDRRLV